MEARPEASIRHPSQRLWLHLLLVVLTLLSTFMTFAVQFGGGAASASEGARNALIFALSLVAILGSHEMGHYVLARIHRVDTTLPFFIPLPFLGVGTLGAVIRIRSRIPNKNALVDIGAAGPLAGIIVALPILIIGLLKSSVVPAPAVPSHWPDDYSLIGVIRSGYELFTGSGSEMASGGMWWVFGDNLLMKGLQWLIVGPLPPGHDIQSHPMVIAGWFGMLVTMLNMIPIGQLDGGHLTFAWFGRHARTLGKVMAAGLLYLALFHSASWILWFFVTTFLIKFVHPPVVDDAEPLTLSRRIICVVCFVAFILCVMPVPLRMVSVP